MRIVSKALSTFIINARVIVGLCRESNSEDRLEALKTEIETEHIKYTKLLEKNANQWSVSNSEDKLDKLKTELKLEHFKYTGLLGKTEKLREKAVLRNSEVR